MSAWLSLGGAIGMVLLGAVSAIMSHRAAKLSEPTGNGWTAGLGERLDSLDTHLLGIAATQGRIEDRVQLMDTRLTMVERAVTHAPSARSRSMKVVT